MADVGRPSELTEELALEIRKLVLEGQSYRNIQEILDIPAGTWDYWNWKNINDFRTNLTNWKHERMIRKAEINIEVLQDSEDEKVALNANTFVLETLGKKQYSKKVEQELSGGVEFKPITGMRVIKDGAGIQE